MIFAHGLKSSSALYLKCLACGSNLNICCLDYIGGYCNCCTCGTKLSIDLSFDNFIKVYDIEEDENNIPTTKKRNNREV